MPSKRHGSLSGMWMMPDPYRSFGFWTEIIVHAVLPYRCFSPSLREVELILTQRGSTLEGDQCRVTRRQQGAGEA